MLYSVIGHYSLILGLFIGLILIFFLLKILEILII